MACLYTASGVPAAVPRAPEPAPAAGAEARAAAVAAIDKGIAWLREQQQPEGGWSDTNFPALTALPLKAMARTGREDLDGPIRRAAAFIVACAHESGIYKGAIFRPVLGQRSGGYINYNTAICMQALHAVGDPAFIPLIKNARAFLARSQHLGPSPHYGGMGYDAEARREYADLSNSYTAYAAMRATRDIVPPDLPDHETLPDLNWEAALTFIQRCHNHPEFNDQSWASDDPGEKGGFAYQPDVFRDDFGAFWDDDGVLKFRSAPGMTYAGLLSYIHAGVNRDDPRVRATMSWIQRNWNPEISNRNPDLAGTPEQYGGLYFMYKLMGKALNEYGLESWTLEDGRVVFWRNELIQTLAGLQRPEGFWVNAYGRYWESDPILVTSYALLALQSALYAPPPQ